MDNVFSVIKLTIQNWAELGWLPSSLAYGFAINALLAGIIIGPVLGLLGTLVVVKRHAFFSEAVGHSALTGVAIGILVGEPYTGPYGSLFGFCLLFGISLNYLRNRTGLAADTLIGVFLSMSLALGASVLLILAGKVNIHIMENVLFGSILTVSAEDIWLLAGIAVIVVVVCVLGYNRFILSSFNAELAAARRINTKLLDYVFVMLITIVTVASVKVIGAILVGALLVIPAAAARTVAASMRSFVLLSVVFALIATVAGMLIPMQIDLPVPSGAAIIICAGSLFLACVSARTILPHLRGGNA